jgi:hypothetical protein
MSCVDPGDTAWVLWATGLVLLMIPALGLFEAGLLRAKSTTSVLTQVFCGALVNCFLWQLIGFSLTFGDSWGFVGSPATYPLLVGVSSDTCFAAAPSVPKRAYAMFQMMFAAITPLLMTGAWAERLRWPAFVGLCVGFECLVYYPVAHWVWGGGWLQRFGVLDFAGGITIHTTAGAGALVTAWFLGPRRGESSSAGVAAPAATAPLLGNDSHRGAAAAGSAAAAAQLQEAPPPSSLPLAAIGGALLCLHRRPSPFPRSLCSWTPVRSRFGVSQHPSLHQVAGLVWLQRRLRIRRRAARRVCRQLHAGWRRGEWLRVDRVEHVAGGRVSIDRIDRPRFHAHLSVHRPTDAPAAHAHRSPPYSTV